MGCQRKAPLRVAQIVHVQRKEDKLRPCRPWPRRAGREGFPTQGQQAELHTAVHCLEDLAPILEVVEAGQRAALHHLLKIELGGVVGGDACGRDDAGAPGAAQQLARQFGKDGVGIHIAPSAQGKATAAAQERALFLSPGQVALKGVVQRRVLFAQLVDHALASRGIGRIGNGRVARREPLLLLQLHPLPRRITQHHVEPRVRALKDIREGQRPVEEAVALRQFAGQAARLGGRRLAAPQPAQRAVGGRGRAARPGQRPEEGRRPQVSRQPPPLERVGLGQFGKGARPLLGVGHALFGHLHQPLLAPRQDVADAGELLFLWPEEIELAGALLLVAPAQLGGRRLVVAGDGLERVVGQLGGRLQVEDAHQTVARLDVGVQKAERLARLQRLHPQRHLAQLHRRLVQVHPVETAPRHFARRRAQFIGRWLLVARARPRQVVRQSSRRGDEKMARTAGRVDDLDGEDRLFLGRLFASRPTQPMGDDRLQRALQQTVDELRRRVVAAGGLAFGTGAGGQGKVAGLQIELGVKLQQRFVDAAQLLRVQVAIIHGQAHVVLGGEEQVPQGLQEVPVGDLLLVQRGAGLGRKEKAAQAGQSQRRITSAQQGEEQAQLAIEVRVGRAAPIGGQVAQAAQAEEALVSLALLGRGLGREQQVPLLRHRQKDDAVDQAAQLVVEVLPAQVAAAQVGAQLAVGRVAQKAAAQGLDGFLHAVAQRVQRARPLLCGHVGPAFQPAGCRLGRREFEVLRRFT